MNTNIKEQVETREGFGPADAEQRLKERRCCEAAFGVELEVIFEVAG